jgi:LPPG:FO 2-phospho-L-lactate transferase
MFERLGAATWFRIGDADLATHAHRAGLLAAGAGLTDAVAAMATALGIGARILPASDEPHRTMIETDEGSLEFQEYFVRLRQEPEVRGVSFEGAARATDAVLAAIDAADLIVIGPSNPIVSIGPILALPGIEETLQAADAPVVAVSPIIAGKALKGPADRMLASLGHDSTALGVARLYDGLVRQFVIDEQDAALAGEIESQTAMAVAVLPTVMRSDDDRASLARSLLDLA